MAIPRKGEATMDCSTVYKFSIAYLDGSIESRRRREIDAHISDCERCRRRALELRHVWGVLDEVPEVHPSAGFDAAVRLRIAQEGARGGVWGRLFAPSPRLVVSVATLLIVSSWLISVPPSARVASPVVSTSEADFKMIADLPVLEDYDVLAEFEVLSEVPVQPASPVVPAGAER
jgi:hypothetical protein